MNSRSFGILLNVLFTPIIYAQLYLHQRSCSSQNLLSNSPLPNVNNLPVASNVPAANNLPFINSLAAESNSPVNRLHIFCGWPYLNGLGNDIPINNALTQNNVPVFNNLPVNNKLANNLASCNLPVTSNVPNLQVNSFAVVPNNLQVDGLPFGNSLLMNGMLSNGYPMTNGGNFNGVYGTNGIGNLQNLNNLANNVPKTTRSLLPNGILVKNGLPAVNTNYFNTLLENNAIVNSKQNVPINNEVQFARFLASNMPVSNEMANNGFSVNKGLSFSPQPGNDFLTNAPAPGPVSDNFLIPGIPTNEPLNALAINNFNNIPTVDAPPTPYGFKSPLYNVLQTSNLPVNNVENSPYSLLNNGQSFISNVAISNMLANNLPVNNIIPNNLLSNNFLANNLPDNSIGNNQQLCSKLLENNLPVNNVLPNNLPDTNLLANTLPVNNFVPDNLPVSSIIQNLPHGNNFNVPNSLSSFNLLNIGQLGNLPILTGLPVIGVTETVTVINTAPSLIL